LSSIGHFLVGRCYPSRTLSITQLMLLILKVETKSAGGLIGEARDKISCRTVRPPLI
jgi:hypothetical protein